VFSDPELVQEILGGSSVAFERLMRRYERLVYRVAYGFTGDHDLTREVLQDTFLKVHASLASWRGDGDLRNWIARIASREASNRERSLRRRPTDVWDDAIAPRAEPSQENELVAREERRALRRALSALGPKQRMAIVLRYFEGMSSREMSGVLGCSEDTARNLLLRGLRALRANLRGAEEAHRDRL
jgi:RNA polymerase sigma-70 factor (ECF subfamily)